MDLIPAADVVLYRNVPGTIILRPVFAAAIWGDATIAIGAPALLADGVASILAPNVSMAYGTRPYPREDTRFEDRITAAHPPRSTWSRLAARADARRGQPRFSHDPSRQRR